MESVWQGLLLNPCAPIEVSFEERLLARRGKLVLCEPGTPVHAAAFIRARQLVFERALAEDPNRMRLIAVHELFHFIWAFLGNARRSSYQGLLRYELAERARGEAGESSGVAKARWFAKPSSRSRWKDYLVESFCDSAAALYAGADEIPDYKLATRWLQKRSRWFASAMPATGWRC